MDQYLKEDTIHTAETRDLSTPVLLGVILLAIIVNTDTSK